MAAFFVLGVCDEVAREDDIRLLTHKKRASISGRPISFDFGCQLSFTQRMFRVVRNIPR